MLYQHTKCDNKVFEKFFFLLWMDYLCHFEFALNVFPIHALSAHLVQWQSVEKKNPITTFIEIQFYDIFTIFFWICFTSLSDYCILNNQQLYDNYLSYFGQKTLLKTQQVHNHHLIILGKGTHRQKTWIIILKRVVRQAHHLVFSRELRSLQGLNDLPSQYYTGCLIVIIVILSLWALCGGQDLTPWTETKNCFKMAVLVWQHLNPVD